MMLDLHGIAAHANPTESPWVIKELGAFMQTWIVGLGTIGRFFANECRRDSEGRWPAVGTKGFWGIVVGALCYFAALGIWIFTTLNLTEHARVDVNNSTQAQQWDSSAVQVIAWSQVGYPILAFLSVMYLNFRATDLRDWQKPWSERRSMPGNQYDPSVSFWKDLFYGSFDVTAKGGLAVYAAMRATWVV
jgi:hypothetical protein